MLAVLSKDTLEDSFVKVGDESLLEEFSPAILLENLVGRVDIMGLFHGTPAVRHDVCAALSL